MQGLWAEVGVLRPLETEAGLREGDGGGDGWQGEGLGEFQMRVAELRVLPPSGPPPRDADGRSQAQSGEVT